MRDETILTQNSNWLCDATMHGECMEKLMQEKIIEGEMRCDERKRFKGISLFKMFFAPHQIKLLW